MNDNNPKRKGLAPFLWRNLPRLFLLLIFIAIGFMAATCNQKKETLEKHETATDNQEKKPVNTVVLKLAPTTVQDIINLPGVIEPWTDLELMARVGGTIIEVLVREGETIRRGTVMARIEEDDYRIALEAAQAAYRLAKIDYDRALAMYEKKATPKASLDVSETRLATARSEMEHARLQLSRCTITAPMDGVISRMDAEIGLLLSIGDPVARMLKIDRVKAVIGIPESDVVAVRAIDRVELTVQALGNTSYIGSKHYLAPAPENAARLYRLELALDNQAGALLPGMFIRATIVKQEVTDGIVVPLYAVISRNDEQYVFVVERDVVRKQSVELGIIDGWQIQVTKGLKAEDRVVIEGHRDIDQGQKIHVVREISDIDSLLL